MSTFQALRKAGLDLKGNKPKGGRIFLTGAYVILQLKFKHELELQAFYLTVCSQQSLSKMYENKQTHTE